MKPLIGIVARSTKDEENYSLLYTVNKAVIATLKCGGIPFLILPTQIIDYEEKNPKDTERLTEENKKDLDKIISMCDGIIIPGGSKWYQYDEYICFKSLEKNIPMLGICAGMQLLTKILNNGKTDGVDETILNETIINHSQIGVKYVHEVNILENTLLYEILGKTKIKVNSRHFYHVPEDSKFVCAYSEDGLIEAVEYKNNKFALGIQWHPESMIDYDEDAKKILEAFIKVSSK